MNLCTSRVLFGSTSEIPIFFRSRSWPTVTGFTINTSVKSFPCFLLYCTPSAQCSPSFHPSRAKCPISLFHSVSKRLSTLFTLFAWLELSSVGSLGGTSVIHRKLSPGLSATPPPPPTAPNPSLLQPFLAPSTANEVAGAPPRASSISRNYQGHSVLGALSRLNDSTASW